MSSHGAKASSGSDFPELLDFVLREELRRGTIEYHSTTRRYVLNGGLPADVRLAVRDLL